LQVGGKQHSRTYDPAYLPSARELSGRQSSESQAHGLYYPPTNPRFQGRRRAPGHSAHPRRPNFLASNGFNGEAAYFTSRGYAWVEVNYRGSTGYGRSYRHAMRQRWGEVDVEDAASCARALASRAGPIRASW
jgi:hypothetical protein